MSIIWLMWSTPTVPGDIPGSEDESEKELCYSAVHFPSFLSDSLLWFPYGWYMFNNKPEITNRTVDTYWSGSVFTNKTGETTPKKGCLSRGSKPHIAHQERLARACDCAWQKPWEAPRPLPDLRYFSATDLGVCTFAQRWIRGLLAKLVKPCCSKT